MQHSRDTFDFVVVIVRFQWAHAGAPAGRGARDPANHALQLFASRLWSYCGGHGGQDGVVRVALVFAGFWVMDTLFRALRRFYRRETRVHDFAPGCPVPDRSILDDPALCCVRAGVCATYDGVEGPVHSRNTAQQR